MIIRGKIISADLVPHMKKGTTEQQEKCEVFIQVSEPTEILSATIWGNQVKEGLHKPFQVAVGKTVILAGKFEEFNKKIQFQLNTNFLPLEQKAPTPLVQPINIAPNK